MSQTSYDAMFVLAAQASVHSLWKNCFVSEKIIPFDSEKIKNFQKKVGSSHNEQEWALRGHYSLGGQI